MKLINWFKDLLFTVKNFSETSNNIINNIQLIEEKINILHNEIQEAVSLIKERTEINADIHLHGRNRNQIIVVGRYRKKDFIEVYTLDNDNCEQLIQQLKHMQKYGVIEKVDAPIGFRAVIDREVF